MKKTKQHYKYLIYLPILVIIIDQITKILVTSLMQLHQSIPIIPKIFHLTYISNTGTLFGLFQDANSFFLWFSIILVGLILFLYDKFNKTEAIIFSLVIGAAIGNLIDRIVYGHVIDFLDFRIWPVFNVADVVVTCSVIFLAIYFFRKEEELEDLADRID
ncbi:signal peptidase II [Candidatus Woesearchaeota archaeon]|jgi:signal peptidase II|nr:signal peptidase II [Candidatus Woesearchaeota archaeon]